ncbi:hypothetical protein [Clostridium sp.]
MDNELLQILSRLFCEKLKPIQEDIKDIKNSQARIENKLDLLVNQTTDLTEVRIDKNSQLEDSKKDSFNVEAITESYWKDISKFKTAK